MRILHAIGFWKTDGERAADWPTPDRLVDPKWLPNERSMLVRYLRQAKRMQPYLGFSSCRFDCGIPEEEMGNCELTDGTFVWPQGLAHYVDLHSIKLPEIFVEFARSQHWRLPPTVHLPRQYTRELLYDFELWFKWAGTAKST